MRLEFIGLLKNTLMQQLKEKMLSFWIWMPHHFSLCLFISSLWLILVHITFQDIYAFRKVRYLNISLSWKLFFDSFHHLFDSFRGTMISHPYSFYKEVICFLLYTCTFIITTILFLSPNTLQCNSLSLLCR